MNRILIVGAGFSGCTIARLLADRDYEVHIIDKRDHIAGNAYDYLTESGPRIGMYGPHIWHTNNKIVHDFVSQFTEWVEYKHIVKALVDDKYVDFPINLNTVEDIELGGNEFPDEFTIEALKHLSVKRDKITNAQEYLESRIGLKLTNLLFSYYSKKMWDMPLTSIAAEIVARVQPKLNRDPYYYPDTTYQALPKYGYTPLIYNMIDHRNISLSLNQEFGNEHREELFQRRFQHCFFSGPIDEYFKFQLGELPYRSIRFIHHEGDFHLLQPVPVINFTNQFMDKGYTRRTCWSIFPNSGGHNRNITVEQPCDYRHNSYERYYPVKDAFGNFAKSYQKYVELSREIRNVTFIGRLGTYRYLDMHQSVGQAIKTTKEFLNE